MERYEHERPERPGGSFEPCRHCRAPYEPHVECPARLRSALDAALAERDRIEAARRESFTNLAAVRAAEAERDGWQLQALTTKAQVADGEKARLAMWAKNTDLMVERDKAEARAERAEALLRRIVDSGSRAFVHGQGDYSWRLLREAFDQARALLAPEAQRPDGNPDV